MRPTKGRCVPRGSRVIAHKDQDFNALQAITSKRPPVRPRTGAKIQRGRSALTHSGHDFNEATVRSRIGAMCSGRPQCDHAHGPRFK